MGLLKYVPAVLTTEHQQALLDVWKRVLAIGQTTRVVTPKSHLIVHLILRAGWLGNPLLYSTFEDESLNKTLKRVLRLVHQQNFERMGLVKLREVLARR